MTTVEIIFAVLVLAFIVLVIYLAKTLCAAAKLLKSLRKQIDDLGHEPRHLVHHVNEISRNISYKTKMLDPLFSALSNVGEFLDEKSENFTSKRRERYKARHADSDDGDRTGDLVSWVLEGANIYKKFRKGD